MKKNRDQYQQGDCIFRRLETMPAGEQRIVADGRIVVAHGESGHQHVIDAPEGDAQLIQIGERLLLKLAKAATLVHEEHGPQAYEPGILEVGRVQEYDYYSKMARPVQD